jgi:hypothetical protein
VASVSKDAEKLKKSLRRTLWPQFWNIRKTSQFCSARHCGHSFDRCGNIPISLRQTLWSLFQKMRKTPNFAQPDTVASVSKDATELPEWAVWAMFKEKSKKVNYT